MLRKPSRDELLALMAEMQRQMDALQQQLGAEVSGSGAVAQDHSVATGAYGTAIGSVQGNVYVGPPARDPEEALAIYRRVYVAGCRQLPMRGIDIGASDPTGGQRRLDLDRVYVALDTTARVDKDTVQRRQAGLLSMTAIRSWGASVTEVSSSPELLDQEKSSPLQALAALLLSKRAVILGAPGAGKSTLLSHLGLCLALHGLEPEQKWLERLPGWPLDDADVVPISVVLRDFARSLPKRRTEAAPQHLWQFIERRLRSQNLAFAAAPLHEALESGRAMVLLDGLDEIPTKEQRVFVRDAVAAFARRYPKNSVVVTCRTLSYQDPAWQLELFTAYELAQLDAAKIDQFIAAWYAELGRLGVVREDTAGALARQLRTAVRRPDLWRLAPNPLLLTVMALVHAHKGQLPDARALLYEETVDILLWRWEQIKAAGEEGLPPLRQLLLDAGRADVDLKKVLWELAFEVHGQSDAGNSDALADIGELRLEKALASLHPDNSRDWAQQVVETMRLRAGLLIERAPEVYTFPHRTFQEYLAGAHLGAQPTFPVDACRLVGEGAFWREVILLAVGRLVYLGGDTARPLALAAELCPAQADGSNLGWQRAWLAEDVLLEIGLNRVRDSALGRELLERVQARLASLLSAGALEARERVAAGNSLARLGDPRFRADAWYLPDEPLLGFVEVPAGPFLMGSDQRKDRSASVDETPQHSLELAAFYMARYPVTVAQFRAFVGRSGHGPADPDSLQGVANHPVVLVTWYDALAYCDWLTETLQAWEGTPEPLATLLRRQGWRITLPSEAQWEKAARSREGRIFPWGDEPDPRRANYRATGIGGTSTVGAFPGGRSPYDLEDMVGNVWEWTRSLWGKDWQKPDFGYPYEAGDGREKLEAGDSHSRVLRGGAFNYYEYGVRCAARYWYYPGYRDVNIGFRVCASP